MNFPISLELLSNLLSGLIIPFFFWANRQYNATKTSLMTKLDVIEDHVVKVNGRVGRLETWVATHENQDKQNFDRYLADQKEMRDLIRDLHRKGGER